MCLGLPCQPLRESSFHPLYLQPAAVIQSCCKIWSSWNSGYSVQRSHRHQGTASNSTVVLSYIFCMVVNGSWTALFVFQAAAQCYIDLIIKESDNNVKLIVLDRLIELKEHPTHERVLQVHMSTAPHLETFIPQMKPSSKLVAVFCI